MKKLAPPFRVGILGGGWAAWAHIQGYNQLGGLFEVRYTCDIDAKLAETRAADAKSARAITDPRAVLADPEIDVVDICLPHHLHAEWAIAAARAGKQVLLEKPLARSYAEGAAIVRAANEAGVQLMVAFNERHNWGNRKIKELADCGRLGRIYMVRTDHNQNVRKEPGHWLRSVELAGGGAVIGSGVHMLDLLRWFGGEASEVYCATVHMPERLEGEVAASVVVTYKAGGIGTLDIMWATAGKPWYQMLAVYGTEGRATTYGGDVTLATPDGKSFETLEKPKDGPFTDSFRDEIRHFGECLADGREPITSGAEALRTQEIVSAAYQSAAAHAAIKLPVEG